MKELEHGYRVIVKYNDGAEDTIHVYLSEKVADSVVRRYQKAACVASVEKEEF